jgi:EVE domain
MAAGPIARLRDGTEVAAWLFKANPAVWDVVGAIAAINADPGAEPIDRWPMVASYRIDLVAPGQPCVLWVTGGRTARTTGVWGMGHVTTEAYLDASDRRPDDTKPWAGLDLEFLTQPIPLAELAADERFARAEIIRAPRVSSPVALTADELWAIEEAWETLG